MSISAKSLTLHLIPLESSPIKEENHWLENNNNNLLQKITISENLNETNNSNKNSKEDKSINKNEYLGETYSVKKLSFRIQNNTICLLDNNDSLIELKQHDKVQLPQQAYCVEVIEEALVPAILPDETPTPNTIIDSDDDIWSSDNRTQNPAQNRFADPLHQPLFQQQLKPQAETRLPTMSATNPIPQHSPTQSKTPLPFLNNATQQTASIHPAENNLNTGNLHIETQSHYTPARTDIQNIPVQNNAQNPVEQGNILIDLGMQDAASTITQREYKGGKPSTSYAEQSPIDMLDEYLKDDTIEPDFLSANYSIQNTNNYSNNMEASNFTQQQTIKRTEKFVSNMKNIFKKQKY